MYWPWQVHSTSINLYIYIYCCIFVSVLLTFFDKKASFTSKSIFSTLQEIYNYFSKAILAFEDGFCGGVYLGGKTIVTAAHCVANKNAKIIYLGVTAPSNLHVQTFRAVKVSKDGKIIR